MKGITILIIGSCVITGIVVYKIYKNINSSKNDLKNNKVEKDSFNSTKDMDTQSLKDIYEIKKSTPSSIKNRHKEAAESIEKSLNTIFNKSENDDILTDNTEDLKKIDSDLNDLLK